MAAYSPKSIKSCSYCHVKFMAILPVVCFILILNSVSPCLSIFVSPVLTASTIYPNITTRHSVMRSEEHTSELQSLMRISYAVFCLKKKKQNRKQEIDEHN